jgi:hypothetical protein
LPLQFALAVAVAFARHSREGGNPVTFALPLFLLIILASAPPELQAVQAGNQSVSLAHE